MVYKQIDWTQFIVMTLQNQKKKELKETFDDVLGNEKAKRALQIAVGGIMQPTDRFSWIWKNLFSRENKNILPQ